MFFPVWLAKPWRNDIAYKRGRARAGRKYDPQIVLTPNSGTSRKLSIGAQIIGVVGSGSAGRLLADLFFDRSTRWWRWE